MRVKERLGCCSSGEFQMVPFLQNWERKLAVNHNNAKTSTGLLLDSVYALLNYYCRLKKVSTSQKKNQSKPWITQCILKSITVKIDFIEKRVG